MGGIMLETPVVNMLLSNESALSHPLTDQFPSTIICTEAVKCSYDNIQRIWLQDGKTLIYKTEPASGTLLMRSEQYALQNEIAVRQLLRTTTVPMGRIVCCDTGRLLLGHPFLVTDDTTGRILADCDLLLEDEESIVCQIDDICDQISQLQGSQFGTLGAVARGDGFSSWCDAFRNMVEDLLEDGEDVLLNLPYKDIRYILACCDSILEEPEASCLMIRGLFDYQDIIVDDSCGFLRIVDFQNLSHAAWVDPCFAISNRDPDDGSPRDLLYSMHSALHDIVEGHYHPDRNMDDLRPRRELVRCISGLLEYIRNAGKGNLHLETMCNNQESIFMESQL